MKGLWRRRTNLYTLSNRITGLARPPGADLPFSCQVSGQARLSTVHPSHQKSHALIIQKGRILRATGHCFQGTRSLTSFGGLIHGLGVNLFTRCRAFGASLAFGHLHRNNDRTIRPCYTQLKEGEGGYSLTRPLFIAVRFHISVLWATQLNSRSSPPFFLIHGLDGESNRGPPSWQRADDLRHNFRNQNIELGVYTGKTG